MKKTLAIVGLRTDEIVQPSALVTILGGANEIVIPICGINAWTKNTSGCNQNYCIENEYECTVNKCGTNKPKDPIVNPGDSCPQATR